MKKNKAPGEKFSQINAIIDWLQFTVKGDRTVEYVIEELLRLKEEDFTMLEKGNLGYSSQMINNNIKILFNGTKEMGVHVIMSGKGCRYYENNNNLVELINRFDDFTKISRIDIAYDDFTGNTILLDKIVDDSRKANIVSRWKTSSEIIKRDIATAKIVGHTISFGSRSSDMYLRFYNKSMEQKVEGNWIRMELEIKGDRAEVLKEKIQLDNIHIGSFISTVINNYIRFLECNERDKNKSRWKTAEYWERIVDTTKKGKLTKRKESKTILHSKKWVKNQIAPTLAMIIKAEEGDLEFLFESLESGSKRLKSKHYKMIEEYIEKKNI